MSNLRTAKMAPDVGESAALPQKRGTEAQQPKEKPKLKCGECDAELTVPSDVILGEIVNCRDCGFGYEVSKIGKDGVELKPAETVQEDWGE